MGEEWRSSMSSLVAELAEAFEQRRGLEQCVNTSVHLPVHSAREVYSIGAKLWRLLQAQRLVADSTLSKGASANAARGGRRPLYSVPPARSANDSAAAAEKLLADMSRHLREL